MEALVSEIDLSPEERDRIDRLFSLAVSGTFYDLLNVAADATPQIIQRTYYDLSRVLHPDRYFRRNLGPYGERLEMVFASLTRAYKTLADPGARARYDRSLLERGIEPSARASVSSVADDPTSVSPDDPSVETSVHEVTLGARRSPAADREARRANAAKLAERLRRPESRMAQQVREQVKVTLSKAKTYYDTGKQDLEAGRFVKAAGALQLAMQLVPESEEYKRLYLIAKEKAQKSQFEHYVNLANEAEKNFNNRGAAAYLQKAAEYDPPDPAFYFRLGEKLRDSADDKRGALLQFRKAVEKAPTKVAYRLALADLYAELNMGLNAKREYQAVLEQDKGNDKAKKALRGKL